MSQDPAVPRDPAPFSMPPEDRVLSPYTGFTRAHWEAAADGLLTAVRDHASPGQALVRLPGPRPSWTGVRSDGLEGFARTFLLAAIRVAGAGGADPHGLLDRYATGLATGTLRSTGPGDTAEAWPLIGDRGQAMVEAASVALALRLTRPWLWDRLSAPVRERAARWLTDGLHRSPHDNNWWLFPVMIGGFLAEAGIETAAARTAVERGLERIEKWYLGDGWYTDGRPRAFDHYNGWALHLYPLLHAHLAADQALLDVYGPRTEDFLADYALTFGGDGSPMHQGRSLIYRFAAAGPLWAGALAGHTPLRPGVTRRVASGALRYFLDRGAAEDGGRLSLGWHGPYLPAVQAYSGPASPYWASKGFLGLLMPPDHPAWTAREEAAPAETQNWVRPLRAPGWLVQSTAADGLVRLHNHGSDNQPGDQTLPDDPHYARWAYSTRTGPASAEGTADNHFGLLGGGLSERGRIRPLGTGDGWAASSHRPQPGVTVTSLVLADGEDELHLHLVTGAAPGTRVMRTGWAVAGEQVRSGTETGGAWVRAGGLHGRLRGLYGFDPAARVLPLPEGTAYGEAAALPALVGTAAGRSGGDVFLCASTLSASTGVVDREGDAPAVTTAITTAVSLLDEGVRVTVRRPDGTQHEVHVHAEAVDVRTTTGG